MNWFERYGIPGAYFIGSIALWTYAFCPNFFIRPHIGWVVPLAGILFIPIGYVISISSQAVYLNWRHYFQRWRRLRGWLGFHGAAMDRIASPNFPQPQTDEAINEARAILLTSRIGDVKTHEYMRNWISRRMDVAAINQSIILATFLAGFIALLQWLILWRVPLLSLTIVLLVISVLVIAVMLWSIIIIRRQVIEVIGGIYKRYRDAIPDT